MAASFPDSSDMSSLSWRLATIFAIALVVGTPFNSQLAAAERTSETDERLADALKRFPQADADKDGVLTAMEARAFQQQRRQRSNKSAKKFPPTHANIKYGPHSRNELDLWLAESDKPTALVICIHGGGFQGGDRSKYYSSDLIPTLNEAGISVAAINYRLTEGGKHPYPAAMNDGARAVQFLRHHADKYGLNPSRFACTGGSAGACMSMWLAFHDDLADANNDDPVLRESTRLTAIAPVAGQPILHPHDFAKLFEATPLQEHPALRPLFGIPLTGEVEWTPELHALMHDASPITHLTSDDPPVYLTYGADKAVNANSQPGVWVHHPKLGEHLKSAMDKLGMECHLNYPGTKTRPGYQNLSDFLIDKLN